MFGQLLGFGIFFLNLFVALQTSKLLQLCNHLRLLLQLTLKLANLNNIRIVFTRPPHRKP